MRIAAMAAGGVGGYYGARLAAAGHDVVFIARGAHKDAIEKNGLTLERPEGNVHVSNAKVSDDPADIARRDNAAIAAAASLLPVTPAEARLAAQFVAADAQAHECLRLSRLYPADLPVAMKCNAQSGCMMRQSQCALRALQRMQEARRKRDSDPVAADPLMAVGDAGGGGLGAGCVGRGRCSPA